MYNVRINFLKADAYIELKATKSQVDAIKELFNINRPFTISDDNNNETIIVPANVQAVTIRAVDE